MKIGDKVRAKEDMYYQLLKSITKDKIYTILTVAETGIAIELLTDTGVKEWYCIYNFEKVEEETKMRWRADFKGKYYYIDDCGEIDNNEEKNDECDDYRYNTGNYTQTFEESEANKEKLFQEQKEKDEFEPSKTYLMEHKENYLVEVRNGNTMRIKGWGKSIWEITNEDLTDRLSKGQDIMKIYKLTQVWQREKAKTMTLAEIEEALGYKIKLREE